MAGRAAAGAAASQTLAPVPALPLCRWCCSIRTPCSFWRLLHVFVRGVYVTILRRPTSLPHLCARLTLSPSCSAASVLRRLLSSACPARHEYTRQGRSRKEALSQELESKFSSDDRRCNPRRRAVVPDFLRYWYVLIIQYIRAVWGDNYEDNKFIRIYLYILPG